MKAVMVLLMSTFVTLTSLAQIDVPAKPTLLDSIHLVTKELSKHGHFSFKEIPIDGPLPQFVAKLKKQGFTLLKTTALDAILKGKFTGEDVHLFVQATSKVVYGVTVVYEKELTWKSIKTQYDNIKAMLTSKYGEPVEVVEKFDSPHAETSGLALYALKEGQATFMSLFDIPASNGMINLKISEDANLVINYVDIINFLSVNGNAYDDL